VHSKRPAEGQKSLNPHPLVNAQRKKFNWDHDDDDDNVEITKNWFYLGSANLSPSAW